MAQVQETDDSAVTQKKEMHLRGLRFDLVFPSLRRWVTSGTSLSGLPIVKESVTQSVNGNATNGIGKGRRDFATFRISMIGNA